MSKETEKIAGLSPQDKRKLLQKILREKAGISGKEYPLSHGQRALWFLNRLAPESWTYNVIFAARVRSELDCAAFKRAFQTLLDRHPSLRTTYFTRHGEFFQRVHDHLQVNFEQEDASTWSRQSLDERLILEAHRPFDLERGPIARVKLFTRSANEHSLLFSVHHIAIDGWSLWMCLDELRALYSAEKNGTQVSLPPPSLQYADYVFWQTEMLAGSAGSRLTAYWQKQLAGELPVLNLPTDRPRPSVQSLRETFHFFKLDSDLTRQLKSLCRSEKSTLYMILLAAFNVLLYRYCSQEDILIGSTASGRSRLEFDKIVGYFANPVVLRADLSGKPTFRSFLKQVRQTVLDAFDHQDYPFTLLVDSLQPDRDKSRSPLFQVMFVLEKPSHFEKEGAPYFILGETEGRMILDDLVLEPLSIPAQQEGQFDLTLLMVEVEKSLSAAFYYNMDLYDDTTIIRMSRHFKTLIEAIVNNPQQCISDLPLLPAEERHQVLIEWNNTRKENAFDKSVHQLFEIQVEKTPSDVAAVFEDKQLSYRELNHRANQLARYLQKLGVGPEVLVGICVERSLELVIGIMGVLKAGGAYVPLDPEYPKNRLAFMLEDSQAPVLLTQQQLVDEIPVSQARVVCLDTDWEAISRMSAENPISFTAAENLAYVIYTSGSTGKPKGAMLQHGGLSNLTAVLIQTFEVRPESRVLQFASLSFDASVTEIFMALLAGATLYSARQQELASPSKLLQLLRRQGITTVTLPPSMLNVLPFEELPALKTLCSAGESCSKEIVARWAPGRLFLNGFGPTEATVAISYCRVDNISKITTTVPIGRPNANTQIYLLDDNFNPLPIGVPGELYIGGIGLARGYRNRPGLTAENFIPNPFGNEPGQRLYKSSDLARYLPDGNIEFLGRIDHQVKIRGFRIELGEIETVLNRHPSVRENVVIAHEDISGDKHLTAYVVPETTDPIELWPSVAEYFVYDDMLYHAMTNDERRNKRYKAAIDRSVKNKVVVDIGTGKDAILARFCIEAGAKKVYAIEILDEAYRHAEACVRRLGLEDKIRLIRGDSTKVQLPEKADVCVSEIVGSIGGAEGAGFILNDARRFLKPDGVMIPERSVTKIAAIHLDGAFLKRPGFTDVTAHYVKQIFEQVGYPFDLRLCLKGLTKSSLISNIDVFEDLDFKDHVDLHFHREITLAITESKRMDGFLVWLNLQTAAGEIIDILEHGHCWLPVYFPVFYPGIDVSRGDTIKAVISGAPCENNLNPDYKIKGRLFKKSGEVFDFEYFSHHYDKSYKKTAFYQRLFAEDAIKIPQTDRTELSIPEIRSYLKKYLPEFMVPSFVVTLENLPMTPNGKVDRRALPAPERHRQSEDAYMAPQNDLERTIAGIWCQLLHLPKVGIHDNFFDLGGNSLLMAQINDKLKAVTNRDISMIEMFQFPTISALAGYLSQGKGESLYQPESDERFDQIKMGRDRLRRQLHQRRRAAKKEAE